MQNFSIPYKRLTAEGDYLSWKKNLAHWCFFNFFLVALLGLGLRSFSVFSVPFLNYKFLIHAHSHFAFGGWILPAILLMIVKYFPEFTNKISLQQLRLVSGSLIISAYGMLLSFPFVGYAPVSIAFSTISMIAAIYMGVLLWKAMKGVKSVSYNFLRAGIIFLALSSLGPMATAPLIATGNNFSPLYSNAIYFYLHFQYNGWFTFAILAVLYQLLGSEAKYGKIAFWLLAGACGPAYLLSVLWVKPPDYIFIIAFMAALAQLAGVVFLLIDLFRLKGKWQISKVIIYVAMSVFVMKNMIQLASAFPEVVDMATARRNFIIAYLHMVLLGFVSLFLIGSLIKGNERHVRPGFIAGLTTFFVAFLITETLLVMNASGIWVELGGLAFVELIFIASIFLPTGIFFIWNGTRRMREFSAVRKIG